MFGHQANRDSVIDMQFRIDRGDGRKIICSEKNTMLDQRSALL
jgi:hypothetical protein